MALVTASFIIPLILIIFVVLVVIFIEHWNMSALEVKKSPLGGRGVYARRRFRKGEIVEVCPLLEGDDDAWGTATTDYTFRKDDHSAIALGYGSLYNHKDDPSASYTFAPTTMIVRANRTIRPGEEITVTYGDDWWTSRDHVKNE